MKSSFAMPFAGVMGLFAGLGSLGLLLKMPVQYDWQRWLLKFSWECSQAAGLNFRLAPFLLIAGVVALVVTIVGFLVYLRLEIFAMSLASERSSQALNRKPGVLSVEEEMQRLIKKYPGGRQRENPKQAAKTEWELIDEIYRFKGLWGL